ncbi:MAG: NADH-quinone oxidoreductase subunit J [Ferroplasma sp.]
MKNKIQRIAVILFAIVIGINIATLSGSFSPVPENLSSIGTLLFSTYLIPFELLSVLLVASIVGVLYIVRDDEQ